MPEIADNLIRETLNLQKRIDALKKSMETVARDALAEIYTDVYQELKEILIDEALLAMQSVEEFDEEIFKTALVSIIQRERVIGVELSKDQSELLIGVNLEQYAGGLELYAKGVQYARKALDDAKRASSKKKKKGKERPYDPVAASRYWKNVIYGKKDLSGLAFGEELVNLGGYGMTMALRFSQFEDKAPFWSLLNDGVPQPMPSQRGGTAYPTSPATRFVDKAIERMKERAATLLEAEMETLVETIKYELANAEDIDNEIASAISNVNTSPQDFREPQIIASVRLEGKAKYIYITETGAIGLSGDPRFQGRRRIPIPENL